MKNNRYKYNLIAVFITLCWFVYPAQSAIATNPHIAGNNKSTQHYHSFSPGKIWYDLNGKVINAHGEAVFYTTKVFITGLEKIKLPARLAIRHK